MKMHDYFVERPTSLSPDAALTWSSGFLATLAITTTMYLLPAVGLPQVDLPLWLARLFVADPVQVAAVGLAVHLVAGFAFAWLYVEQAEPRLTWGPGTSGLVFGAGLWFFVQTVAVPALGTIGHALGPASIEPGFLSARFGIGAAAASLLAHLAYGGVLGYVYGCRGGGRCRRIEEGRERTI